MIAELLLQSIDTAVYNKLINAGVECGQDYNVYRYVDDIFIFAKSEELATHIVEEYSEIARKYLLQLNETKLFSSRVPFVLDGWLNETNGFTNRMCDMLFTSKEEQKAYVEKISAKEDDAETPTSDVLPYLLKSHIIRYGSKAKRKQNATYILVYQQQFRLTVAKLITAMTKEGKFKDAIQDKIGATIDTTDLEKQISVLNASLHQAETIKTRLEQQMDNLDVTDTHYDKKYQIYRDDWMLNMIE